MLISSSLSVHPPRFANSRGTQISKYMHVSFDHADIIKYLFGTISVISDQWSVYSRSLVSVFCSSQFPVKQLKFEMYIILCQYSYDRFILGSKNKLNLVKSTFQSAICSHQTAEMSLKKCGL